MSLKNRAGFRISDSDKESEDDDDPDWVSNWRKDTASSTPLKKVDEVYADTQDRRKRQLLKSGPFKGAPSGSFFLLFSSASKNVIFGLHG